MLLTGSDSHDRSGANGPVAARSLAGAPLLALFAQPSVTAATGYLHRHLAKDPGRRDPFLLFAPAQPTGVLVT
jgi:hypothetical protein